MGLLLQAGKRAVDAWLAKWDKEQKGLAQYVPTASKGPEQVAFERAYELLETVAWPGNFVGCFEQQQALRHFITLAVKGECGTASQSATAKLHSTAVQTCLCDFNVPTTVPKSRI